MSGRRGGMAYLVWLAALVWCGRAWAEDLLELHALAAQSDPAVQAVRYADLAMEQVRRQAAAGLRPSLELTGGYDVTRQDIVDSNNPLYREGASTFDGYDVALTVRQPLLRASAFLQLRQTDAGVERSRAELAAAEQELVRRVAELYMEGLAAQDEVRFAAAEKTALQLHYELARVQQQRGLVPITDLYDAQARLGAAAAQELAVQNARDDALEALREVSGRAVTQLAEMQRDVPMMPPIPAAESAWVEAAVASNLALHAQGLAVRVAALEVDRLRATNWPTMDVVGRGQRQRSGGSLFGDGYETETLNVRVQLQVPLTDGGLGRARAQEARLAHRRAQAQQEELLRAVQRQARAAYLGVHSAIGRVGALRQAVRSSELALEAKEKGFRSGLFASVEVLDAIRDLYRARRDYARARYDYVINSLRLKEMVGTLSQDDLVAVNEWLVH